MLAQESHNIAKAQAKANPIKVTRAQITEMQERREEIARGKSERPEPETHLTAPLVENVNRLVLDCFQYLKPLLVNLSNISRWTGMG